MRLLLPKAASQNAVGLLRPVGTAQRRVVLCAHLDTHRTPVFYSSKTWNLLFAILVPGAWVSMVVAGVAYAFGALLGWEGARWVGLAAAPMELFAVSLCLSADFTPFSPGANDNASAVAAALALAERLVAQPLQQTEVWLAFTGCEEVGAHGMAAFLGAHPAGLGAGAVYLVLEQVGIGRLTCVTAEGLILKRKVHPRALALARSAAAALPELAVREQVGLAYTDALVATKRGLIAFALNALPDPGSGVTVPWHQMSDTLEHVDPHSVASACAFAWQVLHEIDRS
jgi:hypothetical protein